MPKATIGRNAASTTFFSAACAPAVSEFEEVFEGEDELNSINDEIAVGRKVIEAANRVAVMHMAISGARATWAFEIDDTRFNVTVAVADPEAAQS